MIHTQWQAKRAIIEITEYTRWSFREIGKQSGINFATISRIASDNEYMPHLKTRERLYKLQLMVIGMKNESTRK